MPEHREVLESSVESFEADWFRNRAATLENYLPPPDSTQYRSTLLELVQIDWELRSVAGDLPEVEDYLQRFPNLRDDTAAIDLLQRHAARFSSESGPIPVDRQHEPWREHVAQLYRQFHEGQPNAQSLTHAKTWTSLNVAAFEPGVCLAGFRLVRELGRGTFGRVYLGEQEGLAARPVVLKIGRQLYDESQRLASLQHTNIVPIYSSHALGELQLICMPYLGDATLANLLTHNDLGEREKLALVAGVAEGLAHAHQRGIVHRDLKPANILIAQDGTPLLLDFNLATDSRAQSTERELIGGTLPYMAPEQLQAMNGNEWIADARSDIYALGVILCELLLGRHPFANYRRTDAATIELMVRDRREQTPSLVELRRTCPPAVAAMVRHCLEPDPAYRYSSAAQLAEDLRRHLSDLPLRNISEPSLAERTRKLVRRHPRGIGAAVAAMLAVAVLSVSAAAILQNRRANRAEAITIFRGFRDELTEARMLLSLPFPSSEELEEGRILCSNALAKYSLPSDGDWQPTRAFLSLNSAEQQELRFSLSEALTLAAREAELRGGSAGTVTQVPTHDVSAKALSQAAQILASGPAGTAEQLTAQSLGQRASELAMAGAFQEAVAELERELRLQPNSAAPWAQLAACQAALGRTRDAAASYSTCIALKPTLWRAYFWRGQANLELREHAKAELDFNEVLRLRSDHVPSLAFRALAQHGKGDLESAETDLTRAIAISPDHTRLYFMRSRMRRLRKDAPGAEADLNEGMKRTPSDELSWITRGVARLSIDPHGALADFEAALKLNPWSREAAQNKAHVLGERFGDNKQALAALDPIVERFPDFVIARTGRGVYRARLGMRAEAREDAEDALRRDDRPLVLYQVACIHALNSRAEPADADEALHFLRKALRGGFGVDLVPSDPDLDALRDHPEFKRLLEPTRS